MVEDDTFTYPVKQPPREPINTAVHALITKERSQKLDLLIHLLSNLSQSLVVCGPQGIGKTTLLGLLQQRNNESWQYCNVKASADVSFEAIQQQLTQTLAGKSVQSLSGALEQSQGQHKQVVLIIDNAGELVPGLITAIIHYAAANPVLRVIFALTHDEMQVKRGSDKAVDDCHIVEIPTLSEKQCGDFLQHLSTKPALNLPFKSINDNMIAHIYRETHGVPGRIINELSGLPRAKQGGKLKWVLVCAVAGVIAVGVLLWLASNKVTDKTVATLAVEQKTAVTELSLPKPEAQIMLTPPVQPVMQLSGTEPESDIKDALGPSGEVKASVRPMPIEALQEQSAQSLGTHTSEQLSPALEIKPLADPVSVSRFEQKPENIPSGDAEAKKAERLLAKQEKLKQAEVEAAVDPEKISTSSTNHFMLQLMVLSKQASVNSLLKKYPSVTPGIRVIKSVVNGQEKFILEYGSFPDAVSANKARQSLPAEFRNAMVRKIK